MKIDPRYVRFMPPFLTLPGRPRLWFVGRGNTIHLHETAVILEGYLKRLGMPLVDLFFLRVLSEWTTVTVPYSRILSYRFINRRVLRYASFVVVWMLPALCLLTLLWETGDVSPMVYMAILLALLALLLTLYLRYRLLAPRNHLLYQRADGRRVSVTFRITSRKRQEEFTALLESNRRAAGGLARPTPPAEPTPLLPLGLMAASLLWAHLVAPLWEATPVSPATISLPPTFQPMPGRPAGGFVPPRGQPRFQPPPLVSSAPPAASGAGPWSLRLLQVLYTDGLVLLLGWLLWRWSKPVRWLAVTLLSLHALVPLLGPELLKFLNVPGQRFARLPPTAFVGGLVSLLFYGILALLLALCRAPKPAAGYEEDGRVS
jgi:hypothetical protein